MGNREATSREQMNVSIVTHEDSDELKKTT